MPKALAESEPSATAKHCMQHKGTDETTDWDKDQGMCELPVILQEQQWVGTGTDKDIQVRGHTGKKAQQTRGGRIAAARGRLRQ